MKQIHDWISCNFFALGCLLSIFLFYGLCLLFPPTANIAIESVPYSWQRWLLSLSIFSIPIILYIRTPSFRQASWYEKLLWFSIAALLVSLVHNPRCSLDAQILFFVGAFVYAIYNKPLFFQRPNYCHYIVWAYLLWNAVSLIWSGDRAYGLQLLNRLAPLLAYPICFLFFRLTHSTFTSLLKVFWQTCILACVMSFCCSIYQMLWMNQSIMDIFVLHKELIGPFYCCNILFSWSGAPHPSYNIIWILGGMISCIYLRESQIITRFEYLLSATFFSILVVLEQSRIGIIVILIAIIVGFFYQLRTHHKELICYSIASVFLAIGLFVFCNPIILDFIEDPIRIDLLNVACSYIKANPLLGSGIGGMTSANISSVVTDFAYSEFYHFYPHNQFLGDWMQSGVMGFLLVIALTICVLLRTIQKRNLLLLFFAIGIFLLMCIEMPLRFLSGVTRITMLVCLFFNAPSLDRD